MTELYREPYPSNHCYTQILNFAVTYLLLRTEKDIEYLLDIINKKYGQHPADYIRQIYSRPIKKAIISSSNNTTVNRSYKEMYEDYIKDRLNPDYWKTNKTRWDQKGAELDQIRKNSLEQFLKQKKVRFMQLRSAGFVLKY